MAHSVVIRVLSIALCLYPAFAQQEGEGDSLIAKIFSAETAAKFRTELLLLGCILLYLLYALEGTRKNTAIARSWLRLLGDYDGVLARNFAVFGRLNASSDSGQQLWWKESASCFKCYASGRRYCSGALLTLNLRCRQDVLWQLWSLVAPRDDELIVEVFMNEGAMPQTVMALGQAKWVKAQARDEPAVSNYTGSKPLAVSKERLPSAWPLERLAVAAEHPAMFYELMNAEPALAKGLALRWFRSALLSSDVKGDANPAGPRLTFRFALPPSVDEGGEAINTLLSCVFLFVDLLGGYKVSPEQKRRAQELRDSLAKQEAKKGAQDRQEQLQQKKMERLEAERAKARSAGAAALAKFEEKHQAKMRAKELRKRTIKA